MYVKKISYLILIVLINIITAVNAETDPGAEKNISKISTIKASSIKKNSAKVNPIKSSHNKNPNFDKEQIKQIQQIIHDYIVLNPEILLEAGKKLHNQEIAKEKVQIEKIKSNILKYKKLIFDTKLPGRIVTGNLSGGPIMVWFTQHQCPQCKAIQPTIEKLLKNNPEIQSIVVYWPFYGKDAVYAAKSILAAQKQNKVNEVNYAIWAIQGIATKDKIDLALSSIKNLDLQKLKIDMEDRDLEEGIRNNFKLAQDLDIPGTPTFIFANKELNKFTLIPGVGPSFESDFRHALNEIR